MSRQCFSSNLSGVLLIFRVMSDTVDESFISLKIWVEEPSLSLCSGLFNFGGLVIVNMRVVAPFSILVSLPLFKRLLVTKTIFSLFNLFNHILQCLVIGLVLGPLVLLDLAKVFSILDGSS